MSWRWNTTSVSKLRHWPALSKYSRKAPCPFRLQFHHRTLFHCRDWNLNWGWALTSRILGKYASEKCEFVHRTHYFDSGSIVGVSHCTRGVDYFCRWHRTFIDQNLVTKYDVILTGNMSDKYSALFGSDLWRLPNRRVFFDKVKNNFTLFKGRAVECVRNQVKRGHNRAHA